MRLWHESLIPHLDRQRLLGLNREVCALRGLGWGRKHSTVDWAFKYNPFRLYIYHTLVRQEMKDRGYKPGVEWGDMYYRGKRSEVWSKEEIQIERIESPIFPEHNYDYLVNEIELLKNKGIDVSTITEALL